MLHKALSSAVNSGAREIIVISPSAPAEKLRESFSGKCIFLQESLTLPESINFGVKEFSENIKHFIWLGDDDELIPGTMNEIGEKMKDEALLIGHCFHIDEEGKTLWEQRPKSWRLTRFALSLFSSPISQPATLISVAAFRKINGLNTNLKLAFDHDLFARLINHFGPPVMFPVTMAKFRVHDDSLSFSLWRESLRESALVRRANSPSYLVPVTIAADWFRLRANLLLRKTSRIKKKNIFQYVKK